MPEAESAIKSLTCEECRDLLSEYVDREIAEEQRASIERHLTTCTRCATESTRMQGLKNIVRHWDGVQGTQEFHQVVMQRMIRESQQMPSGQINEAAAASASARVFAAREEDEDEVKRLPPIWVLAAALILAVLAYFAILKIRGLW